MSVAWYEIKLKDYLSPGIRSAEKNVDQLEYKLNRLNRGSLGGKGSFDGLNKELTNLGNNANNTGNILKGVFGGITLANLAQEAVSGIKSITSEVINLGLEMEKTRITMKTLLGGDAQFANTMIKDFQQFAKETPFSTKEVVEGAKRLAAYQFQAESMIPTLKKLGDVSSGLGLNLNDLIWVYGTTKVAGKVNARDIRQFQDRGIPITEYLSKATGKTQKEVLGGLKDIDFKDVSKAFDLMTSKGGPFFNLMDQLSKSIGGKWERLKDNVEIIMTDLGERLLPYLGEAIDYMDELVTGFTAIDFREWTEPFGQIFENIKGINEAFAEIFNYKGLGGEFLGALRQLVKDVLFIANTLTGLFEYSVEKANSAFTKQKGPQLSEDEYNEWRKTHSATDPLPTFEDALKDKMKQAADAWKGLYEYNGSNNFFGSSKSVIPATMMGPRSDQNGISLGGYVSKSEGANGSGSDGTDIGAEKIHSATRQITINIDTLVGEITFEQSIQDSTQAVVDAVKRILLTAVNDTNLVSQ